jgi:hypothetical protein
MFYKNLTGFKRITLFLDFITDSKAKEWDY